MTDWEGLEDHVLNDNELEIVKDALRAASLNNIITAREELDKLSVTTLIRLEILLDMLRYDCKGLTYNKHKI